MDAKEAFKLGFVTKLAEHDLSPKDIVTGCIMVLEQLEKTAGVAGVPSTLHSLNQLLSSVSQAALTGSGLLAGSFIVPSMAGSFAGSSLYNLLSQADPDANDIRKAYILERLRQYKQQLEQERANQALAKALAEEA